MAHRNTLNTAHHYINIARESSPDSLRHNPDTTVYPINKEKNMNFFHAK